MSGTGRPAAAHREAGSGRPRAARATRTCPWIGRVTQPIGVVTDPTLSTSTVTESPATK